jgi:hypothetical protein
MANETMTANETPQTPSKGEQDAVAQHTTETASQPIQPTAKNPDKELEDTAQQQPPEANVLPSQDKVAEEGMTDVTPHAHETLRAAVLPKPSPKAARDEKPTPREWLPPAAFLDHATEGDEQDEHLNYSNHEPGQNLSEAGRAIKLSWARDAALNDDGDSEIDHATGEPMKRTGQLLPRTPRIQYEGSQGDSDTISTSGRPDEDANILQKMDHEHLANELARERQLRRQHERMQMREKETMLTNIKNELVLSSRTAKLYGDLNAVQAKQTNTRVKQPAAKAFACNVNQANQTAIMAWQNSNYRIAKAFGMTLPRITVHPDTTHDVWLAKTGGITTEDLRGAFELKKIETETGPKRKRPRRDGVEYPELNLEHDEYQMDPDSDNSDSRELAHKPASGFGQALKAKKPVGRSRDDKVNTWCDRHAHSIYILLAGGKTEAGRQDKSCTLPKDGTFPPTATFRRNLKSWYDSQTTVRRPLIAWKCRTSHKSHAFGAGYFAYMSLEDHTTCIICHEPMVKLVQARGTKSARIAINCEIQDWALKAGTYMLMLDKSKAWVDKNGQTRKMDGEQRTNTMLHTDLKYHPTNMFLGYPWWALEAGDDVDDKARRKMPRPNKTETDNYHETLRAVATKESTRNTDGKSKRANRAGDGDAADREEAARAKGQKWKDNPALQAFLELYYPSWDDNIDDLDVFLNGTEDLKATLRDAEPRPKNTKKPMKHSDANPAFRLGADAAGYDAHISEMAKSVMARITANAQGGTWTKPAFPAPGPAPAKKKKPDDFDYDGFVEGAARSVAESYTTYVTSSAAPTVYPTHPGDATRDDELLQPGDDSDFDYGSLTFSAPASEWSEAEEDEDIDDEEYIEETMMDDE